VVEGGMTRRTREEYEELARLMGGAKEAVGRVQGMIGHMFSTLSVDNRDLPTRYDEKALDIYLALERLEGELDLERQNEIGGSETQGGGAA
jgi:hypothetical protein